MHLMAEASMAIFIATGVVLAIITAIQFGQRAHRYSKTEPRTETAT
jgi:hypothetical protein